MKTIDLTNLEDIKSLLNKYNTKAQKSFGQNFLICRKTLDAIIASADISDKDNILEIGPGLGVLTQELVQHAHHVTAVELDKFALRILNDTVVNFPNLEIIEKNILKYAPTYDEYKIVANIPYNITARILRYFLEEVESKPKTLTLLIQKEVAEKIVKTQGNHNLLSLSVQVFGKPQIICDVSRKKFFPSPKVDSAVIHIELYDKPILEDTEKFFQLIRKAFQSKRKMIRNTLSIKSNILDDLKIIETARPQELSLLEWGKLLNVSNN